MQRLVRQGQHAECHQHVFGQGENGRYQPGYEVVLGQVQSWLQDLLQEVRRCQGWMPR